MDSRMTDDQLDRVLAAFLDERHAEIIAAARHPRDAAVHSRGVAAVRPRFGLRGVPAFTALLVILLLALLVAAFAGTRPSRTEAIRTTEFVHPFRYTLPSEMSDDLSFEDFQAIAFSTGAPDDGEPPFGVIQGDAETTGVRGVLIADVTGGNRHRCPGVTGPSRFPLPGEPRALLDDLRDNGGLRLEDEAAATLAGRPALRVHSVGSECGTDVHLAATGDWIRLNMPSLIIVAEVDRATLLAQIWAGTEAELEAWTPVAQEFLDSIEFVTAQGEFSAGPTLPPGTWTDLLPLTDGRVLALSPVEGGRAQVWDPGTGVFTDAGPAPGSSESYAAAAHRDGRVLVVGGRQGADGPTVETATAWDPATGDFYPIGPLLTARSGAQAVTLRDDRIVVVGGKQSDMIEAPPELWDPSTGRFVELDVAEAYCGSTIGSDPRAGVTTLSATTMADGRVLVLAKVSGRLCAEVWAITGTTATTTELALTSATRIRSGSATVLADDRVLIFMSDDHRTEVTLWDPVSGETRPAGSIPHLVGGFGTAVLADGRVLVVGGTDPYGFSVASAELWDPQNPSFEPSGQLDVARADALVVALPDGRALVAGGLLIADDWSGTFEPQALDTTEVFEVG